MLFHAVDDQIRHNDQCPLIGALSEGLRDLARLRAVLLRQESGLFETVGLVHQFEGFLNVPGLLEAAHYHRVQFRILQQPK